MLARYNECRCGQCGRGMTWIEIAFGSFFDPICGPCLVVRNAKKAEEQKGSQDNGTAELSGPVGG